MDRQLLLNLSNQVFDFPPNPFNHYHKMRGEWRENKCWMLYEALKIGIFNYQIVSEINLITYHNRLHEIRTYLDNYENSKFYLPWGERVDDAMWWKFEKVAA